MKVADTSTVATAAALNRLIDRAVIDKTVALTDQSVHLFSAAPFNS